MPDPIPEGYISLTEAWAAYVREWPGKTDPEQLVEPFADAELHAFVRFPLSDQNYRLLPSSWRDQFFSDRVFLADTIIHTKGDPWSQFSGRTPFVGEAEFQHWLTERCCGEREALASQFDPFTEAWWTLPMAIQWIRKRTPDAAREQWDAFRHAIGNDLKASVALIDLDERPLSVAQEILSKAASGAIQLTAQRASDGEIGTIPANEIPYLSITFDGPPAFGERLEKKINGALGTVAYRELRILFSELERIWPGPAMPFSEKENDSDPTRSGPLMLDRKPATRMRQMTMKRISYPRQQSPDVTSRAYMFLGQIVEWIICRGRSSDSVDMGQKWDAAERELFDYLDTESVKVEGYPVDGRPRIYESLPAGIWAKMNRDDNSGLMFSPIDDTEEREDGGTVCVGKLQWDGVRLPTNVVLKRWPPAGLSPEQPKTVGRRPRYDWAAFREVALAKLDEEGAFDPSVDTQWNKAALERHMAAWCQGNWGVEPSESTIRSKLTEIESAYLEGRKGR